MSIVGTVGIVDLSSRGSIPEARLDTASPLIKAPGPVGIYGRPKSQCSAEDASQASKLAGNLGPGAETGGTPDREDAAVDGIWAASSGAGEPTERLRRPKPEPAVERRSSA